MKKRHEKLLASYLAGNQTDDEKNEMAAAIAEGHLQLDQINELTQFNNLLSAVPNPVPSEGLRSNFYQMLAEEKRKTQPGFHLNTWILGLYYSLTQAFSFKNMAVGLTLLALGIILGINYQPANKTDEEKLMALTTEMQQMKKMMMLTLLDQPTATERLKAVNLTADLEPADDKVIKSLLQTLNHDPSVNVRLAAIEALYQHAENPATRAGLVNAINNQESPLVQLALADVMVAMQEKTAVKPLKKLLKQKGLNEAVKGKVEESLQILI
jgi:hypothetical protein